MRAVLAGIGLVLLLSACGNGGDDGGRSLPPIEAYFFNGSDNLKTKERITELCEGTPERLVNVTFQGKAIYGFTEFHAGYIADREPDIVQSYTCGR